MDVLMLAVTGVALALAVGMSIVAVRLLRGERNRSAARVSALESAALHGIDEIDEFDEIEYREPAPRDRDRDEPLMRLRDDRDDEDDEREMQIDLATGPMFTATDEPKAPGRRWLALAGVAVVMACLVGTMYMVFKPEAVGAAATSSPSAAPAAGSGAAGSSLPPSTGTVSQANQLRPIELLSLKHTIDGTTFSLAGLVVNPIDATPLTHVVAVVYLFDKDGAYFASGKSELEFSGLRPGEESPFTIKIPNVSRIGKYRVGFRREDGSVIAHVDKRGQRAGSMTEGGGDR
jgi:hypothetical protein